MQRLIGLAKSSLRSGFVLREPVAKCPGLSGAIGRKNFARSYMWRTSSNLEVRLKTQDMIPDDFALVYRGGMDNYIHLAYSGAVTLMIGTVYSFYCVITADKPINFDEESKKTGITNFAPQSYTQVFLLYAATFFTLYSLGGLSRNYVLRMYYSQSTNTYRVVRVGYLPSATRFYDLKAGTLSPNKKRSFIPWHNAQYKFNREKFLIFENSFRTHSDFERMFTEM